MIFILGVGYSNKIYEFSMAKTSSHIKNELKTDRDLGFRVKIHKYDIFYDLCDMIINWQNLNEPEEIETGNV